MSLNKAWRIFASAIGFCTIGIFGLLMCIFIFPPLGFFFKGDDKQFKARSIIRIAFKLFLKILSALGLFVFKTDELSSLTDLKGKIIICNHPTLLDVVIIMSCIKNIQCVVKKQLWNNWFLGGVVRNADYIRNDMDTELFLKRCQSSLEIGENVLIFPEGTRSIPNQRITMKRGVGNMALLTNTDIQALYLECTPVTLIKGAKFFDVPERKAFFEVKVGPLFKVDDYEPNAPRSIRVRALMRDIEAYYNERIFL